MPVDAFYMFTLALVWFAGTLHLPETCQRTAYRVRHWRSIRRSYPSSYRRN